MQIHKKYLDDEGKLLRMPRDVYAEYVKTIPKSTCIFCDNLQHHHIISEGDYWVLLEPVSPYFKNHVILNTKRHIQHLKELLTEEKEEYWQFDAQIAEAFQSAGFSRFRSQLHARFEDVAYLSREHLHIHYYEFEEGDFEFLIPNDAHQQDMSARLGPHLKIGE